MVYARHTKRHVSAFWQRQSFDLEIAEGYGNCDLCFMKGKQNIETLTAKNPSVINWWADKENGLAEILGKPVSFHKEWSYKDIKQRAVGSGTTTQGYEDVEIDCFCGD